MITPLQYINNIDKKCWETNVEVVTMITWNFKTKLANSNKILRGICKVKDPFFNPHLEVWMFSKSMQQLTS